jgi:hypothetical protein
VKPIKKLDMAAVLLGEAKTELGAASSILKDIKTRPFKSYGPLPKQGKLFSYLPEKNETLAAFCLNSLVETL